MNFILSNRRLEKPNMKTIVRSNYYLSYYEKDLIDFGTIKVMIDGFVVPRLDCCEEFHKKKQHEFIYQLFVKYGKDFVSQIKGFYLVIIVTENEFILCNDIHSVKRAYFTKNSVDFMVTNSLFNLPKDFELKENKFAPAIMAIFQHFVLGTTLYQNIEYTLPASLIRISHNGVEKDQYWNANDLISKDRTLISADDFFLVFKKSVKTYLEFLPAESISLTLTGGRDTRTILSVLHELDIKPHCFTFGYSTGIDVLTAKEVANACNLSFSNHFIAPLNADSYAALENEIVRFDNPFIHILRAHRLDAAKKEKQILNCKESLLFVGAMGGDYIMGEGFNDYIITEFLRRFFTENIDEGELIAMILEKHFVQYNDETISYIKDLLREFGFKQRKFGKEEEFKIVHHIIGCTHDIQDINLFLEFNDFVIAPFMDIDVMEALFESKFSLFSNNRHTHNPFKRLGGGELQCEMIRRFAPLLANVKFTNQYTPNDLLGNRIRYVFKRIYLHLFKIKSLPTFSYDKWYHSLIDRQLIDNSSFIKTYYKLDLLNEQFFNANHKSNEGYWHRFTNPILLGLFFENFKKNKDEICNS